MTPATRAGCRLRVGVSGHRLPPKLPQASEAPVRALVDRILTAMADAARKVDSERSPRDCITNLVIVSSLAEGADRIVAEAGLAAGFELQVVLPLSPAEYARDFKTDVSREAFRDLLDRASEVLDVHGAPDKRPRAYEAAGLAMLANVDLLIAIWDGKAPDGVGGTADIVRRAVVDRKFVVWIEPAHPNTLQLSGSAGDKLRSGDANAPASDSFRPADVADVSQAVARLLTLPAP